VTKALTKQRWEEWEHQCVKKAFEERIQLKIIAFALGRSLTSVSKMIRNLNLRPQAQGRGRGRGGLGSFTSHEKNLRDTRKMRLILHSYAPLIMAQNDTHYKNSHNYLISFIENLF